MHLKHNKCKKSKIMTSFKKIHVGQHMELLLVLKRHHFLFGLMKVAAKTEDMLYKSVDKKHQFALKDLQGSYRIHN